MYMPVKLHDKTRSDYGVRDMARSRVIIRRPE